MDHVNSEGFGGHSINGRYFARFPVEIHLATENDNLIMENQVLQLLMNLGGVTQEKLLRWCQTEAEFVRRLRYRKSRRGRLEMKAYSILAKVLHVLTLPLSLALWFTAGGWGFLKGFFSNGQNVFIVGLIGLSMAWQAGVVWKVVNATAALDAQYFRSLEEEMVLICFNELTPNEESREVSQLVKSKLYLPLGQGEAGIDYSGVDIDAKLHGLSAFFGNFPVPPAGKLELQPFLLDEVSKFAAEIKGTPLEAVIDVRNDGFWFLGEEVALSQNAEWAVERYASNIANAYDAMMNQVWEQRPSWHLIVGSLKAVIAEEVDTLMEELDCDELLKSAHHRLQTSLIKSPILAKLSGDAILTKFLSLPPPQPRLFSHQLVDETKRELMQAAVSLLVPSRSKNTLHDITYVRPDAEFQKLDFPTIPPTLRFNFTQMALDIDLSKTCHFPGYIYFRLRLHRALHSAFIVYHPLISLTPSTINLSLLYLDSPIDNTTAIGSTTLTIPHDYNASMPLSAHFRVAMTQAAIRSKEFALKLTSNLNEPCLVNLNFD